jgi:hypothetical protein
MKRSLASGVSKCDIGSSASILTCITSTRCYISISGTRSITGNTTSAKLLEKLDALLYDIHWLADVIHSEFLL